MVLDKLIFMTSPPLFCFLSITSLCKLDFCLYLTQILKEFNVFIQYVSLITLLANSNFWCNLKDSVFSNRGLKFSSAFQRAYSYEQHTTGNSGLCTRQIVPSHARGEIAVLALHGDFWSVHRPYGTLHLCEKLVLCISLNSVVRIKGHYTGIKTKWPSCQL